MRSLRLLQDDAKRNCQLRLGQGYAGIILQRPALKRIGIVASVSHGVTEPNCKPLKQHGNACNKVRHEKGLSSIPKPLILLVPGERIELPTNGLQISGSQVRALVRPPTISIT